jgi:Flp pilus assembly pilin Flp
VTAVATALIAMLVTIAAGLAVTWTALSAKPAPFLRNE